LNIASTKAATSASAAAQTTDVTVVGGAGHVGIPLVLAFAEGKGKPVVDVWGFLKNANVVY